MVPKIVKLQPPVISPATVLKEIACTRPMRNGKINISKQEIEEKTVVNCYGHGGSGWTTLFGSVNEAITLLDEADKRTPIRIIGAGCMGLTIAAELARKGFHVSGITTKAQYNLASWQAAALFAIAALTPTPEEQKHLDKLGIETFNVYRQIEKGEHPYLSKDSVRYMPTYCKKEMESGLEAVEAAGLLPSPVEVTLDFGNGVRHEGYMEHMSYFVDTTKVMKQLTAFAIPMEIKEVHAFAEVDESIIFNCTGIGAAALNNDPDMVPVKGHLVLLGNQPSQGHMNYMLYTYVQQDDEEEAIYLFPKNQCVTEEFPEGFPCDGVIGGTFIPHADESVDPREFQKLLERNIEFFYGKR